MSSLGMHSVLAGPCSLEEEWDSRLKDHCFVKYASHNWGSHLINDQLRTRLAFKLLENSSKLSSSVQVLFLAQYRTTGWQHSFPRQFGPLYMTSHWGLDEIAAILLDQRVDIDKSDSFGSTALQIACQNGHEAVARLLLERGADINAKDIGGWTPLILAASSGYIEELQLLLCNAADPNTTGRRHWAATHCACDNGEEASIRMLVDRGSDFNLKGNGWAPSLLAAKSQKHDYFAILSGNGSSSQCG